MAKTPVTLYIKELSKPKTNENNTETEFTREVATFSIKFSQATDAEGQVTGIPRGGKITLRLKALNDGNTDLLCWMVDKKQVYSGSIIFRNTTNGVIMKYYDFLDAYCVQYQEYWEDSTNNVALAHWEEITISCREIYNGPMEFKNEWELVK